LAKRKKVGTLLAVDISGSVGNVINYWDIVDNIYRGLKEEEALFIVLWDSDFEAVNRATLEDHIRRRTGQGGTSPERIMDAIEAERISFGSKLVLITDGEVGQHSVDELSRRMGARQFREVDCHIVSPRPNMSVTCPFTRGNNCQVFSYSGLEKKEEMRLRQEDFELLERLDTISFSDFMANYDKVEQMLISLNMGKQGDPALKTKFVKLQKRFIQETSKEKDDNFGERILKVLRDDPQAALALARQLNQAYFTGDS
jgi:hypothetical protein